MKKKIVEWKKKSGGQFFTLSSALSYGKQSVRLDRQMFFELYKRNSILSDIIRPEHDIQTDAGDTAICFIIAGLLAASTITDAFYFL